MDSKSPEISAMAEITNRQVPESVIDNCLKRKMGKVRINVGGVLFKSYTQTLQRFPHTLLSDLDESSEYYDATENEYFFDRNPVTFNSILDAYRTGSVHMPGVICGPNFREELKFWKLPERLVSECCWESLYTTDDNLQTIEVLKSFCKTDKCVTDYPTTIREQLWNFLHEPTSSVYAKVWCLFISFIILTSVVMSAVETVSTARTGTYSAAEQDAIRHAMQIMNRHDTNTTFFRLFYKKPHVLITVIDGFCFFILTTELVFVVFLCPRKMELLRCWLHISDVLCSLAFWFSFICERNLEQIESPVLIRILIVCKFLNILKLVRLLRIARNFPSLKIMALTLYFCKKELGMMALLLFILTSLFGTVVFLSECAFNDTFDNTFTGMYWALITLTTVGYGNYVPGTTLGQIVAGVCAVCGVIILAMPIGIVASNFDHLYNHYKYVSRQMQAERSQYGDEKRNSSIKLEQNTSNLRAIHQACEMETRVALENSVHSDCSSTITPTCLPKNEDV